MSRRSIAAGAITMVGGTATHNEKAAGTPMVEVTLGSTKVSDAELKGLDAL